MASLPQVMSDGPLPPAIVAALQDRVQWVPWCERPGAAERHVEAIFTYGHPDVSREIIEALPALRVISNHGVGVDHIDLQAARDRGIPVGNTPGVLDGAVADLAFALLLAAARRLPESMRLAADAATTAFDQSQLHGQDVHGATLGIVGLGRIGCEIARRALGFRMRLLYHSRRRNRSAEADFGAEYRELPELLGESDFVVLAVPLTDETRHLIGTRELACMKPTAMLVNIARGSVVNTAALTETLQTGRIAAAALDVTDPEPLPRDHPLLGMPNVIITSHVGSATVQTRKRMAELAVENLLLGLDGQPLRCAVSAAS